MCLAPPSASRASLLLLLRRRRSFDANNDNEDNRKRSQILSTVAAISPQLGPSNGCSHSDGGARLTSLMSSLISCSISSQNRFPRSCMSFGQDWRISPSKSDNLLYIARQGQKFRPSKIRERMREALLKCHRQAWTIR